MPKLAMFSTLCLALISVDRPASGADEPLRFELYIFSGRENPVWTPGDEEARTFVARFDALAASTSKEPPKEGLGYSGFAIRNFRGYDQIRVRGGIVEATRGDTITRRHDEGRALERFLAESAKARVSPAVYDAIVADFPKK